jgi:hypothetical protein
MIVSSSNHYLAERKFFVLGRFALFHFSRAEEWDQFRVDGREDESAHKKPDGEMLITEDALIRVVESRVGFNFIFDNRWESVTLCCDSVEDREAWLRQIQRVIEYNKSSLHGYHSIATSRTEAIRARVVASEQGLLWFSGSSSRPSMLPLSRDTVITKADESTRCISLTFHWGKPDFEAITLKISGSQDVFWTWLLYIRGLIFGEAQLSASSHSGLSSLECPRVTGVQTNAEINQSWSASGQESVAGANSAFVNFSTPAASHLPAPFAGLENNLIPKQNDIPDGSYETANMLNTGVDRAQAVNAGRNTPLLEKGNRFSTIKQVSGDA